MVKRGQTGILAKCRTADEARACASASAFGRAHVELHLMMLLL